ncbi:MAG: SAM-dependent methyltransferase [Lachnospiraceae bacterium]|nr:SAM-dependent methyltransferase [Lachnospiraceae bacterium]
MEELRRLIQEYIDNQQTIQSAIASNPVNRDKISKVKVRPVIIREQLSYQAESFIGTKAYHKNLVPAELPEYVERIMREEFKQLELDTENEKMTVLVSKKGKVTITRKKKQQAKKISAQEMSHNKQKQYVLPKDIPVPFLIDLGVQTTEGKIVNAKYDKFRQINRYLEFVRDILPSLPKDRTLTIIDFGYGKSYLTFALYYYLKVMNKYDIRVIGLDLKEDVIEKCNALSRKYGYDGLSFHVGDISTYDGVDEVDMVVTLHACDTATDYALEKAVRWNAKVILSVPCCQHEINKQIACKELEPILKYGLIKEKMSALITDAIRANLLEEQGYETQILEFIDMEHTPKNILIRAVKKEGMRYQNKKQTSLNQLEEFPHISPTLDKLLHL